MGNYLYGEVNNGKANVIHEVKAYTGKDGKKEWKEGFIYTIWAC
jgi:hypothetical protein